MKFERAFDFQGYTSALADVVKTVGYLAVQIENMLQHGAKLRGFTLVVNLDRGEVALAYETLSGRVEVIELKLKSGNEDRQ